MPARSASTIAFKKGDLRLDVAGGRVEQGLAMLVGHALVFLMYHHTMSRCSFPSIRISNP
jgi:hypothetical protein